MSFGLDMQPEGGTRGKRQAVGTLPKGEIRREFPDSGNGPDLRLSDSVCRRLPHAASEVYSGKKRGVLIDQAGAISLVFSEASRAAILRPGVRAARGIHSRQRMSLFLRTTRAKMRSDSSFSLGSAGLSSSGVKHEMIYLICPFVTIPTSLVQVFHHPVL